MVSPHPSTTQIVAEQARLERLQFPAPRRAGQHGSPGMRRSAGIALVWCGRRLLAAGVRLQMHRDLRQRQAGSVR